MKLAIQLLTASTVAGLMLLFSCEREQRDLEVRPGEAQPTTAVTVTEFQAAGATTQPGTNNQYEMSAYAISDGKRLFNQYNCVGCHAHGGGGMGPPLMDEIWIYGSSPEQIHATILEGRPNGMPAWSGRIPDYQVWEIAAYVRSMAGITSSYRAPGREEHMKGKPPENSTTQQTSKNSASPANIAY